MINDLVEKINETWPYNYKGYHLMVTAHHSGHQGITSQITTNTATVSYQYSWPPHTVMLISLFWRGQYTMKACQRTMPSCFQNVLIVNLFSLGLNTDIIGDNLCPLQEQWFYAERHLCLPNWLHLLGVCGVCGTGTKTKWMHFAAVADQINRFLAVNHINTPNATWMYYIALY